MLFFLGFYIIMLCVFLYQYMLSWMLIFNKRDLVPINYYMKEIRAVSTPRSFNFCQHFIHNPYISIDIIWWWSVVDNISFNSESWSHKRGMVMISNDFFFIFFFSLFSMFMIHELFYSISIVQPKFGCQMTSYKSAQYFFLF